LLAHVLGIGQEEIVTGIIPDLTPRILARFETVLSRRVAREPLAYIVGKREFWSLDFCVGPGVLIPRPESEILIEEALRRFPVCETPLRVADFGTGSGCLLLAFLSERPHAQGTGIDKSEDALAFASRNAACLGLSGRAQFVYGDWADGLSGTFDAIFVNPPYIAQADLEGLEPEITRYEPRTALCGGPDGLDAYRHIVAGLGHYLSPLGFGFVEIGQDQAEPVATILDQYGFVTDGTICDLAGIPRCLVVRVCAPSITPKKELALERRSG
jgi:release factor glutamine methyltransferase